MLSRPQGHSATGRIMSLKNSNDTIGNRTRDLPVFSAVPQPLRHPALHIYIYIINIMGAWGSVVVKAIDSRWCHWGFFPWFLPTKPCALRLTQPLKMSTRDFSCGKGGRCVWLTIYHPCSAERRDGPGLNLPGTPRATSASRGTTLHLYIINIIKSRKKI